MFFIFNFKTFDAFGQCGKTSGVKKGFSLLWSKCIISAEAMPGQNVLPDSD